MAFHAIIQSELPCPYGATPLPTGGVGYSHLISINPELFSNYFNECAKCSTCGRLLDLFDVINKTLAGYYPGVKSSGSHKSIFSTASVLGLPELIFVVELEPEKIANIDFHEHGLPSDARVIYINMTPEGGRLWPAQINQQMILGSALPHRITLFPWKYQDSVSSVTRVNIFVIWVTESFIAPSFSQIMDAYVHLMNNEFEKTIRDAQLALEEPYKEIILRAFDTKNIFPKTIKVITNRLHYSDIITSLLPAITEDLKFKNMPNKVRQGLVELSKLRNQVSHRYSATISETEAANGLTAALFGLHYVICFSEWLKAI